MNEEYRGILDFLQNIFGVCTDREVFLKAYTEQIGVESLAGAEADYRLCESGDSKYLPPYVQAAYDRYVVHCMR